MLWAVQMGALLTDDVATATQEAASVAMDSAGNAYVAGTFEGVAAFGPYNLSSRGDRTSLCSR